jgi:cytochrome c oxidase subunit IV
LNTHEESTHAHIPNIRTLVAVWAALIVLTGTTAAVSYVDVGEWNIVVALLIAVIKASMVAWVFMGVRNTTHLTRLFCVAGLVWLCILLLITASDYTTRNWMYQARPWSHSKGVGGNR